MLNIGLPSVRTRNYTTYARADRYYALEFAFKSLTVKVHRTAYQNELGSPKLQLPLGLWRQRSLGLERRDVRACMAPANGRIGLGARFRLVRDGEKWRE